MHLPPLRPLSNSEIYVSGDVIVHEGAVVAPGVVLQAAPDSRIVIKSGACVGMGAILNAYQGAIEVEAGAILGAGVLMVGQGKIGDSACIGASTTILNASVDAMTVVPPGSLIGDASRQAQIHFAQAKSSAKTPKTATIDSESFPSQSPGGIEAETVIEPESSSPETEVEVSVHPAAESEKSSVVGQVYINQLLVTLFPERQAFKRSQSENSQ